MEVKITKKQDEVSLLPLHPIITFGIALLLALLIWGCDDVSGVHNVDEVTTTVVETTTVPTTEKITAVCRLNAIAICSQNILQTTKSADTSVIPFYRLTQNSKQFSSISI